MEAIQNLLGTMPISGQACPRMTSSSSSSLLTTESITDDQWYWTWYNNPDNSIRAHDEAHGLYIVEDELGKHLAISRETLNANLLTVNTYPDYFQQRTFDRFAVNLYGLGRPKAQKALEMAKRYVDGIDMIMSQYGGGGLYFYSKEKGSGKTFLSTIIGNELSKRGKRVRWYGVTNLLQEIKAGFDRESGTSGAVIIDICKEAEILILDDIGVEKQSAWVNETVYSILDHRMTQCKPTIFTSNVLPRELSYDERVLDRISRMTELIEMPEENVRRKLASKSKLGEYLGKT